MSLSRVRREFQTLFVIQSCRKYRPYDLAGMLNVSKRALLREMKNSGRIGMLCDYNPIGCFFYNEHIAYIHKYFEKAWLIKPQGRLYNIKLRFSPKVARKVADVQWHTTQIVAGNRDGSAIIEFLVDRFAEITWWILSYGKQVEVLAPEILRDRISKIAENSSKSDKHI
ncbi:MAG TPA: WYL domain-containing protein [Planctomycetes bacterium]|nr:WYL domain-containing protein [Planctomycetota bacterium]